MTEHPTLDPISVAAAPLNTLHQYEASTAGLGRLLTVSETKTTLGIGTTKLYELMAEGALDARKLGRRTMITETSTNAYKAGLPKADIRTGRKNVA